VLTGVGGVIGILLGILLAKIITVVAGLSFIVSVPWILIALGFSLCIGIVFGAMPASKAAKLSPIDALRRE
jgi:putative ABC transport system permease protein